MGILSLGTLIAEIINFLVLLALLRYLAYRPLTQMLEGRRRRVSEAIAAADADRQAAERMRAEFEAALAEGRREAQAAMERAEKMAQGRAQEILAEARAEAERLVHQAREDIGRERTAAIRTIERQVAELSVLVAGRILGREIDESGHRQLIQDFVREATEVH